MRRDFIANAAHELRTPLTNLQGYLEALRDGVIAADRATYESLWEEAERLVRLSRSLDALAEGDAATGAAAARSSSTCAAAIRAALDLAAADPRAGRLALVGRRARTPAGARQPRPARPGPRQPPVERGPLHAGRRRPSRSAPSAGRRTCSSRSPTPARASRPTTSTASSSASTGSRSRATGRAAAPGIGLAIVKQLVEAGGGRVGAESADGHDALLVQPARPDGRRGRQGDRDHPGSDARQPEPLDRLAAARRGTRPRRGSSRPDRTTPPGRPSRSAPTRARSRRR